jgi:hypothetical protein
MKFYAVDLEPAFDGIEGWLSITELDVIDPHPPKIEPRFLTKEKDVTMPDGTIFVYAYPSTSKESQLRKTQ